MSKYFKYLLYLFVIVQSSVSWSGAFEDFFQAIRRDDQQAVSALLRRGFDPDTRDEHGVPGLYLALRLESFKVAEALIDWPQTNIEIRSKEDESPLMIAALTGSERLARKLVTRGADINKPGWAPLHYAATHGHLSIMQMLLDQHAYIDAESPNGTTPLMMAVGYGTFAGARLLVDAGADTTLKNQQGLTALDFAHRASRPDSIKFLTALVKPAAAAASAASAPGAK